MRRSVIHLILFLPDLSNSDTLVDLIEDFVSTFLLIEASLHVLESLGELVVENLEFFDELTVS